MSVIGGTICYVDEKRKVVLVHAPEAPQTQHQVERTKIAKQLRTWLFLQRRHNFINSIELRKAQEHIAQYERGEL